MQRYSSATQTVVHTPSLQRGVLPLHFVRSRQSPVESHSRGVSPMQLFVPGTQPRASAAVSAAVLESGAVFESTSPSSAPDESTAPASTPPQSHAPYPLPSLRHTCPPAQPPGPVQGIDIPAVHPVFAVSVVFEPHAALAATSSASVDRRI